MSQLPRYESYKDSGVQWLGEIPSHWDTTVLKFECDVRDGTHDTPEYVNFDENTYPLITSKDLVTGDISFENLKYISQEDFTQISKRSKVDFGDLLMPMIGTVGGAVLVKTKELIAIKNVALFKPTKVSAKWLKYFLDSELTKIQFDLQKTGGVQSFVSLGTLRNLRLLKVPLDEQKIIADFLDKRLAQVDALIAKQETLLEKLAEQRVALISNAVTKGLNPDVEMKDSGVQWLGEIPNHWKTTRIKFLGDIVLGLTYSPEDVTTGESGTLVLRSSNVQNGVLTLDDNVYVEKNIPKKMVTTDQDILICSRNGSRALIGKCALIEGEGVGQAFGAFMTVLRSPYRKYLYYVLSSDLFKYQIGSFLTSTINQLTTYALGNFEIAFPSVEEQKQITDYLDQELAEIEKVKDNIVKTLQTLQEYRSTLITQVVTGKIDVRNLKVN
ncbi:restriction endonuclease subunit S [uncultured Acinetobacter sp.]|uniref:restriction endonuclease subunit S n=1 Tax=uncultured Acinetobacter sp. TaxID=165433 RepID=UPI00258B06C5|nr:restriction endonuclease subunit S [uncultured Acinetobacter sp.]